MKEMMILLGLAFILPQANAQRLIGCKDCNTTPEVRSYRSIQPAQRQIIHQIYSDQKLEELVFVIDSLEGQVDYYTYGEVFLPLKAQVAALENTIAVYGSTHAETLNKTMALLKDIDENWTVIGRFRNTPMFFETINYFELVILKLKRDTYL